MDEYDATAQQNISPENREENEKTWLSKCAVGREKCLARNRKDDKSRRNATENKRFRGRENEIKRQKQKNADKQMNSNK